MDDVTPPKWIRDKMIEMFREHGCTCEPEIEYDIGPSNEEFDTSMAMVTHTRECQFYMASHAWLN